LGEFGEMLGSAASKVLAFVVSAPAPKLFFHLFITCIPNPPLNEESNDDHKRHPATAKRGEGVGTIGDRREAEKIKVLPVLGIRLGIYTEINNR
jgi:hypothetical protein